jgi:hypothetical protein
VGLCFYVLADAVNMRRIWRLARLTDEKRDDVGTA